MTDQEIVKNILTKVTNGDNDFDWLKFAKNKCSFSDSICRVEEDLNCFVTWLLEDNNINGLLFYIPFAKALWIYEVDLDYCEACGYENGNSYLKDEAWQYHIKQIAVEENRIKYIERFL